MKKSFAKRLSPQPYTSKKRGSHKENVTRLITPLNYLNNSKILTQYNESELTDKQLEQIIRTNKHKPLTEPPTRFSTSTTINIPNIRQSIKDILNESLKVNSEIKKLRQKIESKSTFKDSSSYNKIEHPEFDESSIQSSPIRDFSFSAHVSELKSQIDSLNSRLHRGEKKIREKNLENFGLQFTIFELSHKLKKLKKKKISKDKGTSGLCEVF